jgi:MFS family permease
MASLARLRRNVPMAALRHSLKQLQLVDVMNNWQMDRYRQVFQFKSFRMFWLGFTFSTLGDTMTRVALTWFVYETTNSARALGFLTLFYTGPVILGGLSAGWLLDRFDRRKVMLVDNLFRGGVVMLVPLLYATGQLALWHVYAVAAIYGGLMMIPLAGGPALVPDLVSKRHLATANALETLAFTLTGVIGPPVAGVLIARIGAPNVVIFDAATYFAFALALTGIRPVRQESSPSTVTNQSYHLKDAVRLLYGNTILLSTTTMFMVFNLGFGLILVWLPIYADRVLNGGPELYGLLLGFVAIGEVLSSILAGGLIFALTLGTLICLVQFLAGVALGLLLLSQNMGWVVFSLILFGLFHAPLTIWAQTLRMQIIPEALRGRTFALLRTLMQGTIPVGGILAGFLLPILGIPAMIGLSTVLIGIPGLFGYQVKDLRRGGERLTRDLV